MSEARAEGRLIMCLSEASNHGGGVPYEVLSLAGSLLQPDEKLVCWRRPDAVYCMLLRGALSAFSLAVPAVVTVLVFGRREPPSANLWLACTIALGVCAALLALVLVSQWRRARRTLFLLTTERAICCLPRLYRGYQFYELRPEHAGCVYNWGIGNLVGSICWKVVTPPFLIGMPFWVRHVSFGLIRGPKDLRQDVIDVLSAKLIARLKDHDNAVRREAITSLAELATRKSIPIHALAEALRSEDSFIRAKAAKTLGALREAAQPALPCLRIAALDESQSVAQAALHAIEQVSKAA